MLPHAAGAAQVNVFQQIALAIVLDNALQRVGTERRRLDTETLEETVAVGCQVDGSAGFLGQLRAFKQRDPVALGAETHGSCQAANAGADNEDVQRSSVVRHYVGCARNCIAVLCE